MAHKRHNEHRIFFTKLSTWILYKLNSWDVRDQVILNYLIFLLIPLTLIITTIKHLDVKYRWLPIYLSIFTLSPRLSSIHSWAFQSCWHISVLTLIIIPIVIYRKLNWSLCILASFLSILSIFSFSASTPGLILIVGLFLFYTILEFYNKKNHLTFDIISKKLIFLSIAITSIIYNLLTMHIHAGHGKYASILSKEFWLFFMNLVSSGFGHTKVNHMSALFCFLLIVLPITYFVIYQTINYKKKTLSKNLWITITQTCALLAGSASIAIGRVSEYGYNYSKQGKCLEFSIFFIPLAGILWSLIYHRKFLRYKKQFILFFCLFVFFNFTRDWNSSKIYKKNRLYMTQGVNCAYKYYSNNMNKITCPKLYPWDLADKLQYAKKINISFYQSYTAKL